MRHISCIFGEYYGIIFVSYSIFVGSNLTKSLEKHCHMTNKLWATGLVHYINLERVIMIKEEIDILFWLVILLLLLIIIC